MPAPILYFLVSLFSVPAIGIVVLISRYQRDIQAARKRLASLGSQVIETACGPIEYLRSGEGYPVLFVHGAMGASTRGCGCHAT